MIKIPQVSLSSNTGYIGLQNRTGAMCNAYSPLKNLEDENDTLGDFTTDKLNFDLLHPVDIILQDSYDGAVNLLLNDGKNVPRLINSRFSVVDNKEFKIPKHTGNKNTNIYDTDTFNIDTSLKSIAQSIPQIEYAGLTLFGGNLPCGAYTFYFKLADADGNESEILAESGMVQIFCGDVNSTAEVRMGMEDENSFKSVNFKLTNIDSGFDYVHVLYARSSSGNDQASTDTYHKIMFDYPISVDGTCDITITGNELIIGISAQELYVDYADINSVKTQSVVNNVLFFGNISKTEHDWHELQKAAWKITYSCRNEANVGSIDNNYNIDYGKEYAGLYYNNLNTYYRVGYWPDEIYRFGIVYIFNDNSLSPVFNIQGVDFNALGHNDLERSDLFQKIQDDTYIEWENSPEDYYFNKSYRLNSKGVIKFPRSLSTLKTSFGGIITPSPIYIKFDLSNINTKEFTNDDPNTDPKEFFLKHGIKGYFFVRQTRIPTILCLGVAIGLTKKEFGALPLIKYSNKYSTQSFINTEQILSPDGTTLTNIPEDNVSVNALLVPDAEMNEATYNQLFVSNDYTLELIGKYGFSNNSKVSVDSSITTSVNALSKKLYKRKLTNIPEDTKITTDGEVYFSTLAGNPSEPYKTSDVTHDWLKTVPQQLTLSRTVVRGKWGPFVGVGNPSGTEDSLIYGGIYNIKKANYFDDEESAIDLDFQLRMERQDSYSAICDRTEFDPNNLQIDCYRGDCFVSLFTHRVMRNFIDPELPTNDKIINPACWALNYAVRCTAIPDIELHSNLSPDNDGWSVPDTGNDQTYANEVAQAFEVREVDSEYYKNIKWDPERSEWYRDATPEEGEGDDGKGHVYIGRNIGSTQLSVGNYVANGTVHKVNPESQESGGIGGIIKNIFKSSRWALRGLTGINRADVNAVGLGQWITFPICSSKNLSLRDVDYSNATELAQFNRKRSFYPLQKMDIHNPLRDSNVINQAAGISLPHKKYYLMPDVPFIKLEYFTRVINSLRDSSETIANEFKIMLENAYNDYTKVYGSITKLVPMGSKMIVVFEHGIGVLALNDSMSNAKDATGYLPVELSMVISPDYGSMWKDSVIETPKGIYGVDTIAKVIWKIIPGDIPQLQLISNFKLNKFLIDNIDFSEFTNSVFVGRINVKSHYNTFKQDVIFTYYNDILYKFDNPQLGIDEKGNTLALSDYDITSDGFLMKNGELYYYLENPEDPESKVYVQGEKVKAYYDEDKGELITYSKQLDEYQDEYDTTFKWAKGKTWSICFNEIVDKFITFYDWIPVESENIDNIWFSFDREATNRLTELGYRGKLSKYLTPLNEYGGRDAGYGQNAIDPTFNTTVPITYFDNNKFIRFNSITYNDPNKVLVVGVYLMNGANYKITVGSASKDISLAEKTSGWTFIAIRLFGNFYYGKDYTIGIKLESDPYYDYAVTDIIYDYIDNSDWKNTKGIVIDDNISQSELPKYYTVRTLIDSLPLWKHGQAGLYDNADELKPTFWYGLQHEFNFEFIAREDAMHKVFSNLQIISNKTEPNKFEFEVVGESYDWHKYKPVLKWIVDQINVSTDNPLHTKKLNECFVEVLTHKYGYLKSNYPDFPRMFGMKDNEYFEKLPYLEVTDACVPTLDPQVIGEKIGTKDDNIYLPPEWYDEPEGNSFADNTVSCCLVYDKQLNEFRVHTEQLGNDVSKYGRLRGNMQYLEDLWRVEIRPVSFKYAYVPYTIDSENRVYQISVDSENNQYPNVTKNQETRHRDKYIKIKIRYTGKDLAVIQAISTIFDYSYA